MSSTRLRFIPLLKFGIAVLITLPLCFLISSFIHKIPLQLFHTPGIGCIVSFLLNNAVYYTIEVCISFGELAFALLREIGVMCVDIQQRQVESRHLVLLSRRLRCVR
jgi:hypothetical protein